MKNFFKKIAIPVFLSCLTLYGVNLFGSEKVFAQSESTLDVDTMGYTILSPYSFIFHGSYDGNTDKKGITVYFEFKKTEPKTQYNSADLLKLFNKEITETIKIDLSKNFIVSVPDKSSGEFDISPELASFSTYYFRAVAYYNDNPDKKFFGGVYRIDTGYLPEDIVLPYSSIGDIFSPFVPNKILVSSYAATVSSNSVKIEALILNPKPNKLYLGLAYAEVGSTQLTNSTGFLNIGANGFFSKEILGLKSDTEYHFVVYDPSKALRSSPEGGFRTSKPFTKEKPDAVITSPFVVKTAPGAAEINIIVLNEDPEKLKLKVKYDYRVDSDTEPRENFAFETHLLKISENGSTTIKLENLLKGAYYSFKIFDTENKLKPSGEGRFRALRDGEGPQPSAETIIFHNSPTSVTLRASVYNAVPEQLDLIAEYGVGDLNTKSPVMKFDTFGTAYVTLDNLTPATTYQYRIVNTKTKEILVFTKTFTTDSAPEDKGTTDRDKKEKNQEESAGGIVNCVDDCEFKELMDLVNRVIEFIFIDLALPFAALMFAYAGISLITSQGNAGKREQASNIALNTVKGLVVVAAAFLIIKTILMFVLAPDFMSILDIFE